MRIVKIKYRVSQIFINYGDLELFLNTYASIHNNDIFKYLD